ncbi:hypothetical protein B0O99DRAFT_389207 [Bisporella sp. PMI_857]|nr:hypothetical protein B0O99DRAFT_389207 [Bisporella sp. PMI_857]
MFKISAQDIPFVQTGQALLVLDLQNDLVATDSLLHVDTPTNFLENTINLASHFRDSGNNVIWFRSTFETSRLINNKEGDWENIITDAEVLTASRQERGGARSRPRVSQVLLERHGKIAESIGRSLDSINELEIDEEEEETEEIGEDFLTVGPGQEPRFVLQHSPGANFTDAVIRSIDVGKDLIFQKTHYSAFKDGTLVQALRRKFVTEIYICGALSNVSVYATAMDAARHGYAITIIDDCVGYKSKDRHDFALQKLTEFTGCDIVNSQELIQNLQQKSKATQAPRVSKRPRPRQKGSSLENLMSSLNLKEDTVSEESRTNIAESDRSSESRLSNESQVEPKQPPLSERPEKRERVRTKIKTRRRELESLSKDNNALADNSSQDPVSPISATLMAASQALEKVSLQPEGTAKDNINGHKDSPAQEVSDSHVICEGDTTVIPNLLSEDLAKDAFQKVRDEVRWQKMSHQGGDVPRLVCVQGDIAEDGSLPIYRHPADECPPLLTFTPTVCRIRDEVEKKLGHPINHVLIQFYRDGTDHITEHSDKTLDIMPNTFIANVSLGAQRTMVFRTKKSAKAEGVTGEPRKACKAVLPHNSMCRMGLLTNMRWLHGIRPDKRMEREKSEAELAYNGGRISLTFRLIGTFLDKDQQKIWGQGATSKTREAAKNVVNGNTPEAAELIQAFGKENSASEFDWTEAYGKGYDVLHISNTRKLFLSGDNISDLRVKLLLAEYGIEWTEGKLSPSFSWKDGSPSDEAPPIPANLPIRFVDNDLSKSTIVGDMAILCYIEDVYGPKNNPRPQIETARMWTRFQQSHSLLRRWRAVPFSTKPFQQEMAYWDAFATEAPFIAGNTISLTDFVLFPILEDIALDWHPSAGIEWGNLADYYTRMKNRGSIKKVLGYPCCDNFQEELPAESTLSPKTKQQEPFNVAGGKDD